MIVVGDCRTVMAGMEAESVDSVVCDPPYGIGFMGREWDVFAPDKVTARASAQRSKANPPTSAAWPDKIGSCATSGTSISYDESPTGNQRFQAWVTEWATECLRVLKPGGHMVVFGGPRTFHRLTCGLEDAGFEVRDVLCWLFGQGFPKSHNLDGDWSGWGSALKPGYEPIVLCRKPLVGTIAGNVAAHGVGALNIDGCRIGTETVRPHGLRTGTGTSLNWATATSPDGYEGDLHTGRWPANVVLDQDAAVLLDAGVAYSRSRIGKPRGSAAPGDGWGMTATGTEYDDAGGPARYFYTAKVSRSEREAGLAGMALQTGGMVSNTSGQHITRRDGGAPGPRANSHPTVKPIALMRWLVRLVTPPSGLVLDPFTGSGSTGIAAALEDMRFIGIELNEEYAAISERRITHWRGPLFVEAGTP